MDSTDLWSKGGPAGTDNATALGKEEMSPDLQRLSTACSHKAGHICEWPLELNEAAWVPEQVLPLAWSGGT